MTPTISAPILARLSAALTELGARVRTTDVFEGLPFSHDASSLALASVWTLTTTMGAGLLEGRPCTGEPG